MEQRADEDLPWFTGENFRLFSSSPHPQNNPRDAPVPQSPQFDSPARFFSPENHIPLPESNTIGFSQPEIDPFWPETYPSSIYPPDDIEAAFSRLNVSNPSDHFPALSGQGSVMGDSRLPAISYVELQRQRVLSAARGQMCLGEEVSTNCGLNSTGVRNLFSVMNRNPPRIRPCVNHNGFQSSNPNGFGRVNTNLHRMGIMRSEELNPRFLMSSLEDLRGKIFLMAKDQQGCRFLQKKIEERKFEDVEIIFLEIKDHLDELIVHQFGNFLLQKLFEVCNPEQITQILLFVIRNKDQLFNICDDAHGTRAMQKLLGKLTTPVQRLLVISVLRRITVALTKSLNGHHVIQHCLNHFSDEENQHLLNVVVQNCFEIATDKSGCCVLQQCVANARGYAQKCLVAKITGNALQLSDNPYGNYVVQYILGMRIPHVTADVLGQLAESFASLSMNKFGSNVVEKCLEVSEEDQASQIIREIITSPNFSMVLQDPFGNYVAQSALTIAKGDLRHKMVDMIQLNYPFLHSNPYGKRVLARARAISGNKDRQ